MSDAFDPYHTWLGIRPEEQPPNHYRLLGLQPLEDNREAIEHAADQRMVHLHSLQTGEHADVCQRLLNEVAAARVSLLSREKKAAYDELLRKKLPPEPPKKPPPVPPPKPPLVEKGQPGGLADVGAAGRWEGDDHGESAMRPDAAAKKPVAVLGVMIGLVAAGVLLLGGLLVWAYVSGDGPAEHASQGVNTPSSPARREPPSTISPSEQPPQEEEPTRGVQLPAKSEVSPPDDAAPLASPSEDEADPGATRLPQPPDVEPPVVMEHPPPTEPEQRPPPAETRQESTKPAETPIPQPASPVDAPPPGRLVETARRFWPLQSVVKTFGLRFPQWTVEGDHLTGKMGPVKQPANNPVSVKPYRISSLEFGFKMRSKWHQGIRVEVDGRPYCYSRGLALNLTTVIDDGEKRINRWGENVPSPNRWCSLSATLQDDTVSFYYNDELQWSGKVPETEDGKHLVRVGFASSMATIGLKDFYLQRE